MSRLLLEIARIRFVLEAPGASEVVERDPHYAPFLQPGAALPLDECPVQVRLEPPQPVAALPALFRTGEAWTVHADGEDRLLTMEADGSPLWQARLTPGGAVTLRCSPALREDEARLLNPLRTPLDQLLVMHLLARGARGVLVHAAGAAGPRGAVVFPGRSGAGKTTLSRLLQDWEGVRRLGDDRLVLRGAAGALQVHGTPWPGEARIAVSEEAPLAALAFLEQSAENALVPLSRAEALARLLPTLSVLWYDPALLAGGLAFAERMLVAVPAYALRFRPEPGVREVLRPLLEGPGPGVG